MSSSLCDALCIDVKERSFSSSSRVFRYFSRCFSSLVVRLFVKFLMSNLYSDVSLSSSRSSNWHCCKMINFVASRTCLGTSFVSIVFCSSNLFFLVPANFAVASLIVNHFVLIGSFAMSVTITRQDFHTRSTLPFNKWFEYASHCFVIWWLNKSPSWKSSYSCSIATNTYLVLTAVGSVPHQGHLLLPPLLILLLARAESP